MKTNILGLPVKETEVIVNELNSLLSNYQVYYQNLRGFIGISEENVFLICVKFEELYNDSQLKVDMIAERFNVGRYPVAYV
jgi:starvation-inducible DNA-binding protein